MTRRTLLDFFADVAANRADASDSPEFLAFDDGYRTWTWTYAELARQAVSVRRRVATARHRERTGDRDLE